jgi:hypothetical protein
MFTPNATLKSRQTIRQFRLGAAITLLSASFVLAIACSPRSPVGNSNRVVAGVASPTPQASPSRQASVSPQVNQATSGERTALNEQGISFVLPAGWHYEGADIGEGELEGNDGFTWRGPDETSFSIDAGFARPEDTISSVEGETAIEEETNSFYRMHRDGGSEDVRLLEIDSVRGVHFIAGDDIDKSIKWAYQRMYRGRRQVVFVTLTSPTRSFNRHRERLYGILNSIRFIRE